MTTCRFGHSDGAYVLGALSPAERIEYENHLESCPACATAVSRLAPVPGLLRRADPDDLRQDPGLTRLPTLLAAVAEQQRRATRRSRWRTAGASAAAAVLAAAGTAVWLLGPAASAPAEEPPPAAAETWTMEPVAGAVPVEAEVGMAAVPGGTLVWLRCAYPYPDEGPAVAFRLVAIGTDGSQEQLGSWLAAPGDEITMTGVTRHTDDLVRIDLSDANDVRLLSYEFD